MIDLNIKVARLKFKKLGERYNDLWIMLIKPTTRKSYNYLDIIKTMTNVLLLI
jgi:hypothetical protein